MAEIEEPRGEATEENSLTAKKAQGEDE